MTNKCISCNTCVDSFVRDNITIRCKKCNCYQGQIRIHVENVNCMNALKNNSMYRLITEDTSSYVYVIELDENVLDCAYCTTNIDRMRIYNLDRIIYLLKTCDRSLDQIIDCFCEQCSMSKYELDRFKERIVIQQNSIHNGSFGALTNMYSRMLNYLKTLTGLSDSELDDKVKEDLRFNRMLGKLTKSAVKRT